MSRATEIALIALAALAMACGDEATAAMIAPPVYGDGAPAPASVWTPPVAPPPATGPASTSSQARQLFIDKVHPALAGCASCHATGSGGAPIFLQADRAVSYQTIDARAYIREGSVLVSKGAHMGPALSDAQRAVVDEWLALEAKERSGQAEPVSILDKVGQCLDPLLFQAIGFESLVTTPRTGEDENKCTGCKESKCNTCHTSGDGGFYMGLGTNIDPHTFQMTKTAKYIAQYIGLNGTQPVPSQRIRAKQALVATAPPYAHPMFVLSPGMQQAIDTFVSAAIAKYDAKGCGQ